MAKLRILIVDDHEVVREGARALIESESEWEVCGIAANGREAIDRTRELRPDVIVLDVTMPKLNGLEAIREIKQAVPRGEIVVFSAHRSEEIVQQVFDAGAKSYIRKGDAGRYLLDAIRSLAVHKPFFTSEVSEILFAKFLRADAPRRQTPTDQTLTSREREIVRLLADGNSNKEVATSLGISIRTAETHRATLMRKLSTDSLADVVRYAIRNHIIEA
jgi:DNA-binding NarL/FixJ family response regulator